MNINYFLLAFIVMCFYMFIWFIVSLVKKRNDVADIAWGVGLVIITLITLAIQREPSGVHIITAVLVSVWGMRLSLRIFIRNKNKQEDFRYQKWREEWGDSFIWRSFWQVFMLQGFLGLLLISPVVLINSQPNLNWGFVSFIGLLIWLLGFFFETVADYQLDQFIKNKKDNDAILDTGLWKYSRHPNYFGEITMWWGIWFISLTYFPTALWFIFSPILITFLITKVSGIPMLEKKMSSNITYQQYSNKTNVLIPWLPKQ